MKVAYVTSHADMRGVRERFVSETAIRIMKLEHEVKLFCNSLDPKETYPQMSTGASTGREETPCEDSNAFYLRRSDEAGEI
jgi:hypothetical protein